MTNETRINQYVSPIAITADPYFTRFGALAIWHRGYPFYDSTEATSTSARVLSIPPPRSPLRPGEDLEFFVWNPINRERVAAEVTLALADVPGQGPGVVPTDIEAINRLTASELSPRRNAAQEWLDAAVAAAAPLSAGNLWRVTVERMRDYGFSLQEQSAYGATLRLAQGADNAPGREAELTALTDAFLALADTLPIPGHELAGELFPAHIYFNEAHARVIDLQGAANMIVTLAASTVPRIAAYTPSPAPPPVQTYPQYVNRYELNMRLPELRATRARSANSILYRDLRPITGGPSICDLFYDLGRDVADHLPRLTVDVTGGRMAVPRLELTYPDGTTQTNTQRENFVVTRMSDVMDADGRTVPGPVWAKVTVQLAPWLQLYTSPDKDDWADAEEAEPVALPGLVTVASARRTYADVPHRYLRIVGRLAYWIEWGAAPQTPSAGQVPSALAVTSARGATLVRSADVTDTTATGGRAGLSFEIRDAVGAWQTFIPEVAATVGGSKILQMGRDNASFILPTSGNLLRARLDVRGGLETAASIITHS